MLSVSIEMVSRRVVEIALVVVVLEVIRAVSLIRLHLVSVVRHRRLHLVSVVRGRMVRKV